MTTHNDYVKWFETLTMNDVPAVGGKNASLGEMVGALKEQRIQVPDGFATTADAYREFVKANDLESKTPDLLKDLEEGRKPLERVGKSIRSLFTRGTIPDGLADAVGDAYDRLCSKYDTDEIDVAVRSSATAEDLPEASFAGQQETFLNVSGRDDVLDAVKRCFASLFTDRAISYRREKGFDHMQVALSAGVQKMVRSDRAGSGVMFSIDTESGFRDLVVIDAAWGLGENVVQGAVTPDEYRIFKPLLFTDNFKPIIEKTLGVKEKKMIYARGGSHNIKNVDTSKQERRSFVLSDEEILTLARWAQKIEQHYDKPMDIEWAKDGDSDELFILQARPETVQSQKEPAALKTYTLKETGEKLLSGVSIGEAIAAGPVCKLKSAEEMNRFKEGCILVTEMTDPDWVPIMKKAAGIVTDQGGRTCHAAIVSRELGIPAIVGAGEATDVLQDDQEITISCAEGDEAYIYAGTLDYDVKELNLHDVPDTKTRVMMNIASPGAALRWWKLPAEGIGLARMEFIINNIVKIHPIALVRFDQLQDDEVKQRIRELTRGYSDLPQYFVDNLGRGIAKIAAAQYPHPVVVRMSDFKTNEYADLIGGRQFEPEESNPMLGFRGASRYYSDRYREGFALECRAIKMVREEIGLDNVIVMIPFCRTLEEADRVMDVMADNGLTRGENGLKVYVMCEIPSNVILAEEFAERFDGFSIGSNDLTQLTLGIDRDSSDLADLFDERNEAVKRMIKNLLETAHAADTPVGICGQAPSDYPEFTEFLVGLGIDSISLNPDSIITAKHTIADAEKKQA
jgi:pyruvate,water dikinase